MRGVLLQSGGYDVGVQFSDLWTAALAFMSGDFLGPLVITMGGMLIAFLLAKMLVSLIMGRG